jgi:hypothetical protein
MLCQQEHAVVMDDALHEKLSDATGETGKLRQEARRRQKADPFRTVSTADGIYLLRSTHASNAR